MSWKECTLLAYGTGGPGRSGMGARPAFATFLEILDKCASHKFPGAFVNCARKRAGEPFSREHLESVIADARKESGVRSVPAEFTLEEEPLCSQGGTLTARLPDSVILTFGFATFDVFNTRMRQFLTQVNASMDEGNRLGKEALRCQQRAWQTPPDLKGVLRGELTLKGFSDKFTPAIRASGYSAERWGLKVEED